MSKSWQSLKKDKTTTDKPTGKTIAKLDLTLIPPETIKALAEVITVGKKKYGFENWKLCKDANTFVAALFRHLEAHRRGERTDPDSGLTHMSHIMCNAAYIDYLLASDKAVSKKTQKS